jgi:hypothetical protein
MKYRFVFLYLKRKITQERYWGMCHQPEGRLQLHWLLRQNDVCRILLISRVGAGLRFVPRVWF